MASSKSVTISQEGDLISSDEVLFMNLATIKAATDDFSDTNKLGQGGFGAVYKVIQTLMLFNLARLIVLYCDFGIYIVGCSTRW